MHGPAIHRPSEVGGAAENTHQPAPGNDAVLHEQQFINLISLERKRSERSGRPFLLMLIHGGGLLEVDGSGSIPERTIQALLSSRRETDVVGWYEQGSVLAILFTEIGGSTVQASEMLRDRVTTALRQELEVEELKPFRISMHLFPEPAISGSGGHLDPVLYPDLAIREDSKKVSQAIKRAADVLGSLFLLIVLSPILLLTALAVKLTSKGPILFRQNRVGQYGKHFVFLKFRSMYTDCDHSIHREYVAKLIKGADGIAHSDTKGGGVFKITNDPRVTRIGRFLRRSSLDELPQLINVLRGEMSLVGPRPALPYEVERYRPWHRRRVLEVKPGITGLWQVNGRSRVTFDEMVRLDLKYSQKASVLLDLKILFQTPLAVISGDGAW